MMKILVMAMVLGWAASIARAGEQAGPGDSTFRIHLPHTVDTTNLSIDYALTGPFGSYSAPLATKDKVWDYAIPISYEGSASQTLKAIVYCPGYEVELIRIPSLAEVAAKGVTLKLKPQSSVRLAGRVIMPEGKPVDFQIEVTWLARWAMTFFGYWDGMVPEFRIARVDVAPEGSFSLMVPDFAADPSLKAWGELGTLVFFARDPRTGNLPYELETKEPSSGLFAEVELAGKYPDEVILYARSPKKP